MSGSETPGTNSNRSTRGIHIGSHTVTKSPSTAAEYAEHIATRIEAEAASEAPFGFVNQYDGSTAETIDEIDGYDADEHDADNLPSNWEKATGYDYLRDVLDIRYVVNGDRSYRDAQICISLGGPNVWIHTATKTVEVSWGFDHVSRGLPSSYVDALDEAAEEAWEVSA